MQTCHISDGYVTSYRPFNTATPSSNACTDYGLLDQTSLLFSQQFFFPVKEIEDGVCNIHTFFAMQIFQPRGVSRRRERQRNADPDVLKSIKANWNGNGT